MKYPIKVMIVDDEILSIRNLKRQIDWEKSNYLVVAEETNPRNALIAFQKYRPNIVIVDVEMPVMNGLEFSRQISELNIPVKIIILTAYKNFEYVKQALEIGTLSYLIKHEVNENNLLTELNKAKYELEQEEKTDSIIRQQLIRSVIDSRGLNISGRKISNIFLDFNIEGVALFLIKLDAPFHILENVSLNERVFENFRWSKINLMVQESSMDIIELGNGQALILIYTEKLYSEREIWNKLYEFAFDIQEGVRKECQCTASVVPAFSNNDLQDFYSTYIKTVSLLEYSILWGKGKVIDSRKINICDINEKAEEIDVYINRIGSALNSLDVFNVYENLNALFNDIVRVYYNPQSFNKICKKLINMVDSFRKEKNQCLLEELSKQGKAMADGCYNLTDILNWFNDIFSSSVYEAIRDNTNKYSKKVCQALEFINQHYTEDWSIEELAEKLNISSVYIRKLFKKETGFNIVHYLTQCRIEKAKELLSKGDYKIYEVAEMVGYSSSQYFSQVFFRYTGENPLDFTVKGQNAPKISK